MGIIDSAIDAFRFKDTIIYKENSDLQIKYDALKRLSTEYPNNDELLNKLFIVKKGLEGENEILYQLKKSHIGMYVLRDVKLKYKELNAQIDYIVITPIYTYYIECKNLIGNIIVNEKGDFIREININGNKIKKGFYSPLRQVEAQREVIRKIWEGNTSSFIKFFASKNFNHYRRVLVVAANRDTILNMSKAPKDIKYKIVRSDALIRQIEYELNHRDSSEVFSSKKEMENIAKYYLSISNNEETNYYEIYKNRYCKNELIKDSDNLKERLIELRKNRSNELNIPAYYIFTNDELDKLLELRPKSLEELEKHNILSKIKVKTHGVKIIEEVNR